VVLACPGIARRGRGFVVNPRLRGGVGVRTSSCCASSMGYSTIRSAPSQRLTALVGGILAFAHTELPSSNSNRTCRRIGARVASN